MSKRMDITGKKFGKLTVLYPSRKKDCLSWWIVQCECGIIKRVRGQSMKQNQSLSCGVCTRKNKRTAHGQSAKWSLFSSYVINAKRRNYSFTLSLEEFLRITGSACTYCGIYWSSEYPNTIYTDRFKKRNLIGKNKLNGTYKHNGIDRVDNNIGYVTDNCVPCCKDCNIAKQRMSIDQFKSWVFRAYHHINKSVQQELIKQGA